MSRFRDARSEITGTSWLDDLARASLLAAEAKFDGRGPSYLAVDVDTDLDASSLATITRSVQSAVARVGSHIANPKAEANQVRAIDLERTRLFVRRNAARRIEFSFAHPNRPQPVMFGDHPQDEFTAIAAMELAELLPESARDSESVQAVPARDRASLNAIRDLVTAVQKTSSMSLHVIVVGNERNSVLTADQATMLADTLLVSDIQRERIEVSGRLDGVRTRRRVFFFEAPGHEYEGGFEQDLAETVKSFIDEPAIAILERVRRRPVTGIAGRWSYRLLHLRPPGTPPPELESMPIDELD